MEQGNYRFVIVTGMSGGGKTQAYRYLEDLGFFCVDNLPPVFIPKFAELCVQSGGHIAKVVLVVDTRSREFFDTFLHVLEEMESLEKAKGRSFYYSLAAEIQLFFQEPVQYMRDRNTPIWIAPAFLQVPAA